MNDTPPAADASQISSQRAAVCLGIALLAALFLVLAFAWRDHGRRASLETTMELTAVGDSHFFPMPAQIPLPPYPVVAAFRGQELSPADYVRHNFPADDMARVGVDEKGGYVIYRGPPHDKDANDPKLGPIYFLKISPKEYLRVVAKAK